MGHDRFGLAFIITAPTDAATAMFAMHKRAVRLNGVAIHEPSAVNENLHMTIRIPAQKSPVWHVGPDQPRASRLPGRPLAVNCAFV